VRAPGRPRDAGIDEAILLVAWEQLNTIGYPALTMTAVAEGAGVQKPALYRRWPTRPLLAIDALAKHLPPMTYSDRGSLRDDLSHALTEIAQAWSTPVARRCFATLLAEIDASPELVTAFQERVVTPRNAAMRAVLERAKERGELRPDAPLDVVADLVEGPLMHRAMLGNGRPLDRALLDGVLDSCLALLQER
jgi:AcrR family transcriptional regulator